MKKLLKIASVLFVFILSLLFFFPKVQAYYFLENELAKKSIFIDNEKLEEKINALKIQDFNVIYKGINISSIKELDFDTLLLTSNIEVKNISTSKDLEMFLPSTINELILSHDIFTFNQIKINAISSLGHFNGTYDVFTKTLKGELKPNEKLIKKHENILKQFKKIDGRYTYEYRF